tara:strand:- start:3698 stop:3937 length:240 start_codon:yes stop_codon:yes gene_type:complete
MNKLELLTAEEAKRLKADTSFLKVLSEVRERQKDVFVNSANHEVEKREDAHAIIRAVKEIEVHLDAAIAAETLLQLRRK